MRERVQLRQEYVADPQPKNPKIVYLNWCLALDESGSRLHRQALEGMPVQEHLTPHGPGSTPMPREHSSGVTLKTSIRPRGEHFPLLSEESSEEDLWKLRAVPRV